MSILKDFFSQLESHDGGEGLQDEAKRAAAEKAMESVESGMKLGLGTGSTVEFFLQALAKRISQGLEIVGVPTSTATEKRCRELGIPLVAEAGYPRLESDYCVDGADRVDLGASLIKGGGGALLREKLVAAHSKRVCILVDPSKLREVFDNSFPLPVECVRFGIENTVARLQEFGCDTKIRLSGQGERYHTDSGNFIVDCTFGRIPEPQAQELSLASIPGVVDSGLFCELMDELIIGFPNGSALHWSR